MLINKDELKQRIADVYGANSLTDGDGCSVLTNDGWVWLSIANLVNIIDSCIEYDD